MNDSKEQHSTGSYVEPRIPSITGFGQRKVVGKPKKVLDYSWEKCNDNSGTPKIDVCLRLKPRSSGVATNDNTLSILSDTTVGCNSGNAREDVTEYTFSSVFGPNVDQEKFFNSWVYEKAMKFLNGSNELLFAYGTTNAGKTYTIHGNSNDPGIIPRTLVLVFNSIGNKLMSDCKYKPDKVIAAHILDEKLIENEENIRNNILNNWANDKIQDEFKSCTFQVDDGQTMHSIDQLTSNSLTKMFDLLNDDRTASLDHGNVSYTVWVTYSEIYNESIYDLLVTYVPNQKRTPLKLSLDQNKNVYVRDLTHVFVKTAEEAYKVMAFGRNNLRFASNNLNKLSSRSHCIFTLKLMRVENVENPKTAVISSISFCDLAGSERLKKTMNIGERLTESKNINTSLLVLNKCFSVLRENQKRGENHLVPYRESKLTQMFQTALTGNNRVGISMAVNVDMSPSLFEETKQVLFMSAIVRAINKTKQKSKPRPSFALWANNCKAKTKQDTIVEDEENIDESVVNKPSTMLTEENFEVRLKEAQAILRQQLVAQFKTILENNNTFHKNQKDTMLKNKTAMYETKINRLKAYHAEELIEKDAQLAKLNLNHVTNNRDISSNKSEIENFEFQIGELHLQNEELLAELNILKSSLDMQKADIEAKNQEIETYKTMLNEANDEYERLETELNDKNNKVEELFEEIDEKNIEIERLTGSLEAKDNFISEIESQQDELIAESVESKISEYMDEKLEIIYKLENNVQKLKLKLKKCTEENSTMAKQYQNLKQRFLEMSKNQENSNDQMLKISELQNTINNLKSSIKPETRHMGVLTEISNVNLPLSIVEPEDKENKLSKSDLRPQRKLRAKTPSNKSKKTKNSKLDSPDNWEEEAIDQIPISTRKRKLFDNKPPLADSSNMTSDLMSSLITPSRVLNQVTKLRVKK